jgi:hypothetical protein
VKKLNENIELSNIGGMGPLLLPTETSNGSGDTLSGEGDADGENKKKRKEFLKKFKTFEQFVYESTEKFPDELTGNDNIIFKKQRESPKGAKYSLYYNGYDIEFGGVFFNSVNSLKRFMNNYVLSNNIYNKLRYKTKVEIGSKESNYLYESN